MADLAEIRALRQELRQIPQEKKQLAAISDDKTAAYEAGLAAVIALCAKAERFLGDVEPSYAQIERLLKNAAKISSNADLYLAEARKKLAEERAEFDGYCKSRELPLASLKKQLESTATVLAEKDTFLNTFRNATVEGQRYAEADYHKRREELETRYSQNESRRAEEHRVAIEELQAQRTALENEFEIWRTTLESSLKAEHYRQLSAAIAAHQKEKETHLRSEDERLKKVARDLEIEFSKRFTELQLTVGKIA